MGREIRRQLIALGFVVLAMAGCGSTGAAEVADGVVVEDSNVPAAEDPAGVTTSTSSIPTEDVVDDQEPSLALRDPAAPFSVEATYEPEAEPLAAWGAPFDPGTYRNGALGTPISFTTTEALITQNNGAGTFAITDLSSRAPDDRDIFFIRVSEFSDPRSPHTNVFEQEFWPKDDFLGWVENLHENVIASTPIETTINGLAAVTVDLELKDEAECGFHPGGCVGLLVNDSGDTKALNHGAKYRAWIVEQGGEAPLAIVVGIARNEDAAWFARADAVLDTLAFGAVEPHPAQWLVPGVNDVNILGGVEVTISDDIVEMANGIPTVANAWNGRSFSLLQIFEQPAVIFFSEEPRNIDGTPLATADEFVDILAAAGDEISEVESVSIDGVETRVFDFGSTDVGAIRLKFSLIDLSSADLGWDAPAAGRIWLIEHPDRGLMMISANVYGDVDALLPGVNELAQQFVETIDFTE